MFYFVDVVCPICSKVPVTSYVSNRNLFNEYKSSWSGTSSETGGLDLSLVVKHFLYLNLSSFTVGFGHIICTICHTTTHDLDCAAEYTKSGVKKKKKKLWSVYCLFGNKQFTEMYHGYRAVHML